MAYVYILKCADNSYYTGSTHDLVQRVWDHKNGRGANYTGKRLPVRLVFFEEVERIDDAYEREKQIQGWGRRKKEALIEENWERLKLLSRNYAKFGKLPDFGEDIFEN